MAWLPPATSRWDWGSVKERLGTTGHDKEDAPWWMGTLKPLPSLLRKELDPNVSRFERPMSYRLAMLKAKFYICAWGMVIPSISQ